MRHVQKLFFVPVGLPGMGKSTLAKNIRLSVQNNLSFNQQNHGQKTRQAPQLGQASNLTSLAQKAEITDPSSLNGASAQALDPSLQRLYAGSLPSVDF